MTCVPVIRIKKGSWDTRNGGVFAASTGRVTLIVDYCGTDAEEGCTQDDWPERGTQVVNEVGFPTNLRWDIRIGRPLQYYNGSAWVLWQSSFTADQTAAEITANEINGWVVKSFTARQVNNASNGLWEIDIELSLMTLDQGEQFPHMSVDITTQSRLARAYRGGSGLLIPTRNATGSGPVIGTPASGYFEPINWRNGVKADMDCGGYRLDINAQPVTLAIEQRRIAISFVIRKPYIDNTATTNNFVYNEMWEKWGQDATQYLNKRNETTLFGYDPGELLIESINVSSIDDQFSRCELVLLWDEWGHFDQSAWGLDGTVPDLDEQTMAASPDRPILVAETVFWTTSFHETFTLSTTDFPKNVWDLASIAIT